MNGEMKNETTTCTADRGLRTPTHCFPATEKADAPQEGGAAAPVDAAPSFDLQTGLSAWGDESDPDETSSETTRASFLLMPMLEQIHRQPYHSIAIHGPFHLKELLNEHRPKLFRSEARLSEKSKPLLERLLFIFGEGVFAVYEPRSLTVYARTPEKATELAVQFRRYVRPPAPKKPGFHLLRLDGSYPESEFVPLTRPLTLTDEAVQLHYGTDFIEWEQDWIERLAQRTSGVSVLFGPPGCGKTTYLRALMAKLLDRHVFYYLPISEFEVLSNPRFVGFWLHESRLHDNAQKIAILEDAEELLMPRDEGNRDKVSNLLNIGDGFLGDHLKLHVVATTNVPIQSLDPAVTRPGRLMGAREFPRLSRASALRLAEAKGITSLPEQTDYSLAEIYCRAPLASKLQKARRLGFA
jgi:hypothetical protein